jgi:formiminoglutamase
MTTPEASAVARDANWLRASEWLAAGPGNRPVDLAFLGVPAWRTSLSPTQAHRTPGAVRAALHHYSTFAASSDVDLAATVAARDLGDVEDPDSDEGRTTRAVRDAVADARLLVACGGDNSITYAVMRGALPDLATGGLVTLDAHHDLRDGVSNGSPVRRLIEAGLDASRVVQIGISDFANSRVYSDRARKLGITVVHRRELEQRPIAEVMRGAFDVAGSGGGGVYVDLDVDVCDRSVAPGCPASAPGGLSAEQLRTAAYEVGRDQRVAAVDITEVDAAADAPDGRTVRLAA